MALMWLKELYWTFGSGLFLALYPPVITVAIALGFLAWRGVRVHPGSSSPLLKQGLDLAALLPVVWLLATAGTYVLYHGYNDHFEAVIASIARAYALAGQRLYHDLDAVERYSIGYGPNVFLLNAIPQYFVADAIAASKVAGIAACAAAVALFLDLLRREFGGRVALRWTGYVAAGFLMFENFSFWNRPDPFLILGAVAGLYAARRMPTLGGTLLLGGLVGVELNLKIHGVVYLLPALGLFWQRRPRIAELALGTAAFAIAAALPFWIPQVAVLTYLNSLSAAVRHGLDSRMFQVNLAYLLLFTAPLVAAWWLRRRGGAWHLQGVFFAALGIELLIITVIGSKPGAGAHHFLPALPAIAYACACLMRDNGVHSQGATPTAPRKLAGRLVLGVSASVTAVIAMGSQVGMLQNIKRTERYFEQESRELQQIVARAGGHRLQMGYDGWKGYRLTYLRPYTIVPGADYWIDAGALMDYDRAGLKMNPGTVAALAQCRSDVWIVPSGEPLFSMTNEFYSTKRNIFGSEFATVFAQRYFRAGSTGSFDVWRCSAS